MSEPKETTEKTAKRRAQTSEFEAFGRIRAHTAEILAWPLEVRRGGQEAQAYAAKSRGRAAGKGRASRCGKICEVRARDRKETGGRPPAPASGSRKG